VTALLIISDRISVHEAIDVDTKVPVHFIIPDIQEYSCAGSRRCRRKKRGGKQGCTMTTGIYKSRTTTSGICVVCYGILLGQLGLAPSTNFVSPRGPKFSKFATPTQQLSASGPVLPVICDLADDYCIGGLAPWQEPGN